MVGLNCCGMRTRQDEQVETRNVTFTLSRPDVKGRKVEWLPSWGQDLLGITVDHSKEVMEKVNFKHQRLVELDSERRGNVQGGINFLLALDRSRNVTLLVKVEEGWMNQLVWKSKQVKTVKLNGLFCCCYIWSKGTSWDLSTETGLRCLKLLLNGCQQGAYGRPSWGRDP